MPIVEWGDVYVTGDSLVDSQHRGLFGMINALHAAVAKGQSKEVVGGALDQLERAVVDHFATETRLMKATAYGELARHVILHDSLATKAHELIQNHRSGKSLVGLAALQSLGNWLTGHVVSEDKKMIEWARVRGGTAVNPSGRFPTNAMSQPATGIGGRGSETRLQNALASARESVGRLPIASGKLTGEKS